jgi:hypothetical protein
MPVMVPEPFVYPIRPIVRRHGPAGYMDYQSFKPWLRDEFAFACVFCRIRECWFFPFGSGLFSVEHMVPRRLAPERDCDYENLVYSCLMCNSLKGDQHPLLDPTHVGYGEHFLASADGLLNAITAEGTFLLRALKLNRPGLRDYRRELFKLVRVARQDPAGEPAARLRKMMAFPDDLPDLASLRPPGGNTRPDGLQSCYFAQRQRGELPASY